MAGDERIMMQNPNTGRDDMTIRVSIFEPVRDAILGALDDESLTNAQITEAVERHTDPKLWADNSLKWFVTTVKLHLEATEMLTKAGRPQVLSITEKGRGELRSN